MKSEDGKRGSLVRRFNWTLFGLYVVGILLATPAVYFVTTNQVHRQAERELNLLVDMVKSIQGFVAKDLRPYFLQNHLFYSPGISGIVVTSRIAENFKGHQPDYYIKNASDNPLNPANGAKPLEHDLLNRFRENRELGQWVQSGSLDGRDMLISAVPKVSRKGCLKCHGDSADAPEDIRSVFKGESGYNYRSNEVVGVSLVGVPLQNVNELVLQRTALVLGMLTVLFALIFFTINGLVKKYLLWPLVAITRAAHDISHGKLDSSVQFERNDEIGDLARSVELVRRSVGKLLQRMKRR